MRMRQDPWPLTVIFDRLQAAKRCDEPLTPELIKQAHRAWADSYAAGEPLCAIGGLLQELRQRWISPTPDEVTVALLQLKTRRDELQPFALGWAETASPTTCADYWDVMHALAHYSKFCAASAA